MKPKVTIIKKLQIWELRDENNKLIGYYGRNFERDDERGNKKWNIKKLKMLKH